MKTKPFIILFFCILTTTLSAQTADEIIARHIETLGGLEKIKAIKANIEIDGSLFKMPEK